MGHGLDLVRLAARPDPGFPKFPNPPALIEVHGYPELTSSLKQKVFGLNGARVYGVDVPARRQRTEADPIGTRRQAYRQFADPTFETYGPKTDTEYEALIAERGGLPA
jgi:uncharacterized protein